MSVGAALMSVTSPSDVSNVIKITSKRLFYLSFYSRLVTVAAVRSIGILAGTKRSLELGTAASARKESIPLSYRDFRHSSL